MRAECIPEMNYPGIYFRQLEKEDLQSWYDYLSIKEVYEGTSWNLNSVNDLESLYLEYNAADKDSAIRLAVIDENNNTLIGTIGFHTISTVNKSAEIAYDLSPAYWKRGIATAMCKEITSWGFSSFGFIRIQATVLETNSRSESVLTKCGYQYEGLLKSYRMVRGVPGNFKLYSHLAK
ncbi:GNAT family N-acetyltransferase [Pedobacter cryoconitis]|uniref:GNAT family N-acetyltransferase n=1 Tax=Pedobacter cryoconitis TaxID=188932 RepID=UPI00160F10A5|nr:GNAT family protein [Pedobacter cryoconitis]MBB5645061.1 RimJ/RimL family protein N-acetyltransferase [Pedobacter cryoconitis]